MQYDLCGSHEKYLQQAQRHAYGDYHESESNDYIKLTINCRHYYFQHHFMSIN